MACLSNQMSITTNSPARRLAAAAAALATAFCLAGALAPDSQAAAEDAAAGPSRIGMHSMLTPGLPYSAKEAMFREAAAVGASYIRVDLLLSGIFTRGEYHGRPVYVERWGETDEYAELADKYGINVLAVLYGTPAYIADCPAGTSEADAYHCPPAASEISRYKEMVATVTRRYATTIKDFEVINEPDNDAYFYGDAAQYARTLSAAADAIHGANPVARVAIGGVSKIKDTSFVDAVLAADPSIPSKIDINTIHLRASATGTAKQTEAWRSYFTSKGMRGPLWMTEFGYPADPAFQYDSSFKGGETSQADFLKLTMPWIVGAGGDRIFVTERDWGTGAYASEGILETPNPLTADPKVRRRAAFAVVKEAAASLSGGFPPGRSVYVKPEGTRTRVRKSRISMYFACPSAGDCPVRAVRMRLSRIGTMRVSAPFIVSGATVRARPKLSSHAMKTIQKRGRRGVKATVTDFRSNVLGTFTIVR